MGFKVKNELPALVSKVLGSEEKHQRYAVDMLNTIGWQLHADAVEMIIRGPKRTGKKYKRGGKIATRSAYGEPAKIDTGNLQSSLDVMLFGANAVRIGYLQSVAPYGEDLEDPSKLNRPVLVPVKTKNITFIKAQIKRTANRMMSL